MRAKLSPRYIRPYEVIEKLNLLTYRLDLPIAVEHVHNVFHISQLKKYVLDPDCAIITKPIEVIEDLVYEKCPVQMLEHRTNQLHNE